METLVTNVLIVSPEHSVNCDENNEEIASGVLEETIDANERSSNEVRPQRLTRRLDEIV